MKQVPTNFKPGAQPYVPASHISNKEMRKSCVTCPLCKVKSSAYHSTRAGSRTTLRVLHLVCSGGFIQCGEAEQHGNKPKLDVHAKMKECVLQATEKVGKGRLSVPKPKLRGGDDMERQRKLHSFDKRGCAEAEKSQNDAWAYSVFQLVQNACTFRLHCTVRILWEKRYSWQRKCTRCRWR